ncbi:MAG TPA: glycosyltransferase family 2 protein [Vicinamibacterales bacterium]|jgi:glycosyltransferase involved in cell wall biosynthesis|nr:glycosyltransferase family 2 protein [Vicinamibacterales bacterium]
MSSQPPLISVVFSFRNERQNIPTLIARLDTVFSRTATDYELLFVNDASDDGSLDALVDERSRNPRVKVINMSRRFGVSECARAGMSASSGDATIIMDADLQDPPEVIPQLLEKWRAGADVVHTVRTRRHGESALKMMMTRLAYRIIHLGSSIELPVDAGDFKLLSRPALNHLLALTESDPYIRGLVVWIGFQQAFVPYERDARHAGKTHFPFFSRNPWKTFAMGLTSFSFMPIFAVIALALGASGVTVLLVLYVLLRQLLFGDVSTALVLAAIGAFFWTTTLVAVAAVGIYVIRIYKDIRNRPQYIVASTLGVSMPAEKAAVERVTM